MVTKTIVCEVMEEHGMEKTHRLHLIQIIKFDITSGVHGQQLKWTQYNLCRNINLNVRKQYFVKQLVQVLKSYQCHKRPRKKKREEKVRETAFYVRGDEKDMTTNATQNL